MNHVPVKHHAPGEVPFVAAAAKVARAKEALHDPCLVIELNDAGEVVGLQILDVSEFTLEIWRGHPDCGELPTTMLQTVEEYLTGLTSRRLGTAPSTP